MKVPFKYKGRCYDSYVRGYKAGNLRQERFCEAEVELQMNPNNPFKDCLLEEIEAFNDGFKHGENDAKKLKGGL